MCSKIKKHEKQTYVTSITLELLKSTWVHVFYKEQNSYSTFSPFVIIKKHEFKEKKKVTLDIIVNL